MVLRDQKVAEVAMGRENDGEGGGKSQGATWIEVECANSKFFFLIFLWEPKTGVVIIVSQTGTRMRIQRTHVFCLTLQV